MPATTRHLTTASRKILVPAAILLILALVGVLLYAMHLREQNTRLQLQNMTLQHSLAWAKLKLALSGLYSAEVLRENRYLRASHRSLDFRDPNGVLVHYYGRVIAGKAEGYGFGIFDGKGVYRGFWKSNLRHGQGHYIWRNGDRYEGQYYMGHKQGYGIYYFSDGSRFAGEWKNNLRDGEGTFFGADGKVLLKGLWRRDKFIEKVESAEPEK